MNQMQNYKEIIEVFKNFAENHIDVMRFHADTEDRFDDFSNFGEEFPLMYFSPISSSPVIYPSMYKSISYTFLVKCVVPRFDLEQVEDDHDINYNQTTQNLNQTDLIFRHFLIFMQEKFDNVNFSINPLNEFGIDRLQGWELSVSFESGMDNCY